MIAHIFEADGQEQTVEAHCQETAAYCSAYAAPVGAECIAKLQGLLHDAGKLTEAFQSYIRQESGARRGEIDHLQRSKPKKNYTSMNSARKSGILL